MTVTYSTSTIGKILNKGNSNPPTVVKVTCTVTADANVIAPENAIGNQLWFSGVGSGGSGGGGKATDSAGGGGGGGGGYHKKKITIQPGETLAVVIGAAVNGGTATNDGNDGNDTTLTYSGGVLTCPGGKKGLKGDTGTGGDGGCPTSGNKAAGGIRYATYGFKGSDGTTDYTTEEVSGGGGGGSGVSSSLGAGGRVGANAGGSKGTGAAADSGGGGASLFGAGANGGTTGAGANAGANTGGGGGGGYINSAGGNSGSGKVVMEWYIIE